MIYDGSKARVEGGEKEEGVEERGMGVGRGGGGREGGSFVAKSLLGCAYQFLATSG